MDETTKRAIKKTILTLRKLLEGKDIPAVLRQYGIFPDGRRVPVEKLALLDDNGKKRRGRLEAVIEREIYAAGGEQKAGVQRYCREVAFTYLNRLVALRCIEVRGLIDESIKVRDDYAGRSLRHNRFLKERPGIQFDHEDTDGLKAFLYFIFKELHDDIKMLFDPDDEYSIVMPTLNTLRECVRALNEDIPESAFKEPELIGWVYQYFQVQEKDRVFEEVRTKKKKIEGDDIVPATSLYTERYMVDYLVQNSLGTTWMEMYPDSKLYEKWPYFVKNQDLKPREPRPVKSLTFLDPASGSGHFHLVAFDLLSHMYEEEFRLAAEGKIPKEWVVPKEKIATTILESNLHGIDIDLRSVQLSYLVLYLRMREHQRLVGAAKSLPRKVNLVAADASLLNTTEFLSWCEERLREEPYAINIIKGVVGRLRSLSEIGSLARPEEDLKELVHKEKERLLSAWKKEKNPRQAFLFQQMLTPEQRELPFEKITDDQFWEGVISRVTKAIDEYYREASERGDTRAQVLAHEASRGFKFLELCNKRYDVVATNPPFMGKRNMTDHFHSMVKALYPHEEADLFACFIRRCSQYSSDLGSIAMVSQSVFMYLDSFQSLREHLIIDRCFQSLAFLGAHAFSEITGEKVNVVIFVSGKRGKQMSISAAFIDLQNYRDKGDELLNASKCGRFIKRNQGIFTKLPRIKLLFWATQEEIKLLIESHQLSSLAKPIQGMKTADNNRFLRRRWEVQLPSQKWIPYVKGGEFGQFYGNLDWCVDYSQEAQKFYSKKGRHRRGHQYYYKEGLTYSSLSGLGFSLRYLSPGHIFDQAGSCIFPKNNNILFGLILYLNTPIANSLLRTLNPGLGFLITDLEELPVPASIFEKPNHQICHDMGQLAVKLRKEAAKTNLPSVDFDCNVLSQFATLRSLCFSMLKIEELAGQIIPLMLQKADSLVRREFNLVSKNASYPLIEGYAAVPELPLDLQSMPNELKAHFLEQKRLSPTLEELKQIKSRLRALYEAGPGAKVEEVVDEEENPTESDAEAEAESLIGKRIPIPTETFLEELSLKMEIHPVSIHWLLDEMREKDGLISWPECERYVEDYFTVIILMILGFRWPKQIKAGEQVPDWADKDGIIPITEHTEEKTLLERIRDRIGVEFGENKISDIESEFADILFNATSKEAEIRGKTPPKKKLTLPQWLEKEFFKKHTSQFKKRPIAWHLTSSNGTFQVLIFCHKISLDMFKNLKNRHLARVQSYYGSLLEKARRGESVPGGLTAGKLSDIESELEEFSNKLNKLIAMPYEPLFDDGVRVNIAPLQKLGLLAFPVLAAKDVDLAIADRNRWREEDKEQTIFWNL